MASMLNSPCRASGFQHFCKRKSQQRPRNAVVSCSLWNIVAGCPTPSLAPCRSETAVVENAEGHWPELSAGKVALHLRPLGVECRKGPSTDSGIPALNGPKSVARLNSVKAQRPRWQSHSSAFRCIFNSGAPRMSAAQQDASNSPDRRLQTATASRGCCGDRVP